MCIYPKNKNVFITKYPLDKNKPFNLICENAMIEKHFYFWGGWTMKPNFVTGNRRFLHRACSVIMVFTMVLNLLVGYQVGAKAESIKAEAGSKTQSAPYRNVMYYGEWSIYGGQKYFYPSKIDGSLITHLNFAFLDVDSDGELVLCDEHADFLTILPEQQGLTYGEPYAGYQRSFR